MVDSSWPHISRPTTNGQRTQEPPEIIITALRYVIEALALIIVSVMLAMIIMLIPVMIIRGLGFAPSGVALTAIFLILFWLILMAVADHAWRYDIRAFGAPKVTATHRPVHVKQIVTPGRPPTTWKKTATTNDTKSARTHQVKRIVVPENVVEDDRRTHGTPSSLTRTTPDQTIIIETARPAPPPTMARPTPTVTTAAVPQVQNPARQATSAGAPSRAPSVTIIATGNTSPNPAPEQETDTNADETPHWMPEPAPDHPVAVQTPVTVVDTQTKPACTARTSENTPATSSPDTRAIRMAPHQSSAAVHDAGRTAPRRATDTPRTSLKDQSSSSSSPCSSITSISPARTPKLDDSTLFKGTLITIVRPELND